MLVYWSVISHQFEMEVAISYPGRDSFFRQLKGNFGAPEWSKNPTVAIAEGFESPSIKWPMLNPSLVFSQFPRILQSKQQLDS